MDIETPYSQIPVYRNAEGRISSPSIEQMKEKWVPACPNDGKCGLYYMNSNTQNVKDEYPSLLKLHTQNKADLEKLIAQDKHGGRTHTFNYEHPSQPNPYEFRNCTSCYLPINYDEAVRLNKILGHENEKLKAFDMDAFLNL